MPVSQPSLSVASPDLEWVDGAPRSRRYGDVYFSIDDGLAEARAVFLAGCGLPDAWAGRRRFVVGELGFGSGLNIAALLDLWDRNRPSGGCLHVFTIEAHPLSAAEAARALSAWPELGRIASMMTARWPGRARGFHRIDLPELAATIDVAVMEAAEALQAWPGTADAWFLDGFAPALNPDMWRDEVVGGVARHSAAGARAATYTVAGAVRRSLAAAGFVVERKPGHGRKRERLEAGWPGESAPTAPLPTVAIIGAGIAGASLARAFRDLGVEARVFDQAGPGAGGSGAPAGLMAPRLDAGLGPAAALFAQAARRAARLYDLAPGAVIARGAVQRVVGPKDQGRFAAIAGSDLFEPETMIHEHAAGRLTIGEARVVRPSAILGGWLGGTKRARVAGLRHELEGWRLLDGDGEVLAAVDIVVVAAAVGSADLVDGLDLTPVRGQASFASETIWPTATLFGAYVIPAGTGLLFGATHDRGETSVETRIGDRVRNLASVAQALPDLAERLATATLSDWAAIRATTHDYLPLAGPAFDAPPGLWLLTGLGSRGFCLAPLLAEHIAAGCLDAPSPLPISLAALVDPGRFAARAARKGRPESANKPTPA